MRNKYFEKWWLLFHAYEPSGTLPGCTHIRGTVHYCVAHEYVKPHCRLCVPVSARVTENTQKPHPHPRSTWLSDDCHLLDIKREKGKGQEEFVLKEGGTPSLREWSQEAGVSSGRGVVSQERVVASEGGVVL